ncbi:MAG: alpha/beta hydrolase [Clostridiales bacterium]|nr:alpha/beta hydrolase [Clostridiales bacterium]
MRIENVKLYENREDVTLTAYVLNNSEEYQTDLKRPAVLICPGGAYFFCSDREAEPVALAFSAMGYQTFVLRYSVNPIENLENKEQYQPKKERIFPAQVQEIGMAVSLIRNNADKWLVDTQSVIICGFSAGAHNCALYSVYWNKPVITDSLRTDLETLRPSACILGYPLTDYLFMKEYTERNLTNKGYFELSNLAFAGEESPNQEMLRKLSPALLVDEMTPPTFIWGTASDELVPIQHSIRYAHALANHNVPFELHIFEEGLHGMSLANQVTATEASQDKQDVAGWVGMCDTWLKKRFSYCLH